MATYYGLGPDGAMGHIRLKESLEEWHVRCAEQGESLRRLRADVGTAYSRRYDHKRLGELEAFRTNASSALNEIRHTIEDLTVALSAVITLVDPETAAAVGLLMDPLPEPEGGWSPGCPDCTP
jgi:hypothetical protein